MRKLILAIAVFLPQAMKIGVYRRVFKWRIGRNVRIGLSYIDAERVDLGDGVRIGHLTAIRGLRELRVGRRTFIGNLHWVVGGGAVMDERFRRTLIFGDDAWLISRHFIDATGFVEIGDRTSIAGQGTHIWSHRADPVDVGHALRPDAVHIGSDVYVGARSTLLHCSLPDHCVVGAASVVTKRFPPQDRPVLVAGNPARIVKEYH